MPGRKKNHQGASFLQGTWDIVAAEQGADCDTTESKTDLEDFAPPLQAATMTVTRREENLQISLTQIHIEVLASIFHQQDGHQEKEHQRDPSRAYLWGS